MDGHVLRSQQEQQQKQNLYAGLRLIYILFFADIPILQNEWEICYVNQVASRLILRLFCQ